jgi:O-antigen ligase
MTAVLPRPRAATRPTGWWVVAAGAAACLVGAGVAVNAYLGLAMAVVAGMSAVALGRAQPFLALMTVAVFFELVRVSGTTLTRLVTPVALLVVAVEVIRRGSGLRWNNLLMWVCAYATWAVASGLWTVSTGSTLYLLQSLAIALVYMLAFAILPTSIPQLKATLHFFVFSSIVVGALAIAAFAGHPLGLNIQLQAGRAQGGVGDPNFFANIQLVALPLAVVLAGETRSRALKLALIVGIQVILGSILVSLSRGGFLAAIAEVALLTLTRSRALYPSGRQKAAIILVLALGFGFLMTGETVRHDVTKRFDSIFSVSGSDPGSENGSSREAIWAGARLSIRERPLLGLGYGSFAHESNDLILRAPDANLTNFRIQEHGIEAHNVFLSTAAELGYPGLALLVGMLASMLLLNQRTAQRARAFGIALIARLAVALQVSVAAWAVSSIFISTETSRPLWMMIGLSLLLAKLVQAPVDAAAPTPSHCASNAPRSGYRPTVRRFPS